MFIRLILLVFVLFLTASLYCQNALPVNPAAYWKLDDSTADVAREENGNYNGVGQNGPTPMASALFQTGFMFQNATSADDEYILLENAVGVNSGSFTLSAWVCPTALPANDELYIFGGGIGLALDSELHVVLSKPADSDESATIVSSDLSVILNTWSHIAVAYDSLSKKYSYFINGEEAGSGILDFVFDEGISYIAKAGDSGGLFKGSLDELRIYYGTLSLDNIKILSNFPPSANDNSYTLRVNGILEIPAPGVLNNDSDPDNEVLTTELKTDPEHGTLALKDNGGFVYIPDHEFSGLDSFTYQVSDGKAKTEALVSLNVSPEANNQPVAVEDAFSVLVNSPLLIQGPGILQNDYDVDHDLFSAVSQSEPRHGVLALKGDGSLYYIPDTDFEGDDFFTYVIKDSNSDSNLATVNISVILMRILMR